MQVVLPRPNGLHILTKATLHRLATDETLLIFAAGLLTRTIAEVPPCDQTTWTLARVLHYAGFGPSNGLLTALLVLDAEINAVVDDETRIFPLPGFLGYRNHLPPDKYPLNTLRLPPLNPDGHYLFTVLSRGHYLAARLDIHPELKIAGHVRIALSSPPRPPPSFAAPPHPLDRQALGATLTNAVNGRG